MHILSGLSPQEHALTRVATPSLSNIADNATNAASDSAWNLLCSTFSDKGTLGNCYRFCTATYRAVPRRSSQQGGAGTAKTTHGGGQGALHRLGLDLHTSHTAQVCEIKEVQSSEGLQRLVHLRSASIVWRGAMSWSSAEWWPPELQRLVRVNRVQQLAALRKAMAQLVRGEDHELFDFWMVFDDFMAFFHIVQLYQDTIGLPQTGMHQRGSDDEAGKWACNGGDSV